LGEALAVGNDLAGHSRHQFRLAVADALAQVGRWNDALDLLGPAIHERPDTEAVLLASRALDHLGRWSEAIQRVDEGLGRVPCDEKLRACRAEMIWKSGRRDEGLALTRNLADELLTRPDACPKDQQAAVTAFARRLFELNRIDDAVERLSHGASIIQDAGVSSALHGWAAQLLERNGRYREAEQSYRQALVAAPDDVRPAMALTSLLAFTMGLTTAALKEVELVMDVEYVYGRAEQATIFTTAQRRSEADLIFEDLSKSAANHLTFFAWGFGLIQGNDPDRAEDKYREALDCCPGDWRTRYSLAATLDQLGRHREAWQEWDAVLIDLRCAWEANGGSDTSQNYAQLLLRFGEASRAAEVVAAALLSSPSSVSLLATAVDAEVAMIDDREVPDESAARRRATQRCADARRALGEPGALPGEFPVERERAVAVASACVAVGNYAQALEIVKPLLAHDEDGRLHAAAAVAEARRENHRRAIELFRRSVALGQDDLLNHTNLGDALRNCAKLDQAATEYRRVLRITPDSVDARLGLAETYVLYGESDNDPDRYEEAIDEAGQALRCGVAGIGSRRLNRREQAEVHYLMGYAWVKRHERGSTGLASGAALNNAKAEFKFARQCNPNLDKARRALVKLKAAKRLHQDMWTTHLGWMVILPMALITFCLAQGAFFLSNGTAHSLSGSGYLMATFGSLLFLVVGLCLPQLLKLKVGSIEMEKTAASEATAPVPLSIRR